jgi:hypothetical protein
MGFYKKLNRQLKRNSAFADMFELDLQYFSAKQSSVSNNTFLQLSFLKERQHTYKINTMSLME